MKKEKKRKEKILKHTLLLRRI